MRLGGISATRKPVSEKCIKRLARIRTLSVRRRLPDRHDHHRRVACRPVRCGPSRTRCRPSGRIPGAQAKRPGCYPQHTGQSQPGSDGLRKGLSVVATDGKRDVCMYQGQDKSSPGQYNIEG